MAFVQRFTEFPPLSTLTAIEAIDIIDLAPAGAEVGAGTGTLLAVGEFEDGPFATGAAADAAQFVPQGDRGPDRCFSQRDFLAKFGGLGFTYGTSKYNNASARRHVSELWNGNGFLKLYNVRAQGLVIARVDTSVGQVAFAALAFIQGGVGPYNLEPGQQITVTTNLGGPALSTAIAALVATVAGANFVASGFVGGETITIAIDGGSAIPVVFTVADQTEAQVAARINTVLGYTAAAVTVGVDVSGIVRGTAGRVVLAEVTAGALAAIGHVAGSTAGTGNVANVDAATAAEIAAIITATAALIAIGVSAVVDASGAIRVRASTPVTGTINITSGVMALALGLDPLGTTVSAATHAAGFIPAGTRVRTAGLLEWVTMQTLTIPEGTAASPQGGTWPVKVRPALDDGTAVGTGAATVTTVVDQPSFGELSVTNGAALSVALTEPQMDAAYAAAFDATLSLTKASRRANFSLSARRSVETVRRGRQNAIDASNGGCSGRKFITGSPLGFTQAQAIADVATWRSDRVFYTWPAWKTTISEIAEKGALAGGLGFTDDGVITVRADGPLASICCQLPPENNPGEATGLIEAFFAVEDSAGDLGLGEYTALRAAGICAPRRDVDDGSIYQSGVTSTLERGRTTIARRKMADFIQDTFAVIAGPYNKQVGTDARKDALVGDLDTFLATLLSTDSPERQRIKAYGIDDTSGNSPTTEALGIFVVVTKVRTLSSLDDIVLQTEIGESVIVTTETA